jgi:hypothetical protein
MRMTLCQQHVKQSDHFCKYVDDLRFWQMFTKRFVFVKIIVFPKVFVKICVSQEQMLAAALKMCCFCKKCNFAKISKTKFCEISHFQPNAHPLTSGLLADSKKRIMDRLKGGPAD